MNLHGVSVTSAAQFTRAGIEELFRVADVIQHKLQAHEAMEPLKGYVLASLFFENSSRTYSSFTAAMQRLGGSVLTLPLEQSSMGKGETLSDTLRTVEQYSDAIVMRHPRKEALDEALAAVRCPVLNAGNGTGEHPTQSLLDAYTIRQELGTIDGLHVALVGDLKNGRTVHSLVKLLTNFKVARFSFVAPEALKMPEDVCAFLARAGIPYAEFTDAAAVIESADVLYVTRVQKERFASVAEYEAVRRCYTIDRAFLARAKPKMVVMHPLPRNDELSTDLDNDPRAAYFRQMHFGMIIRMALLLFVFGKERQYLPRSAVSVVPQPDRLQLETLGRRFQNPFMNAAGVLCSTEPDLAAMEASASGALVTKSCTRDPRQGNPEPRYCDTSLGSINSMGLPNLGFSFYKEYAARRGSSQTSKPLLFSVSGLSLEETVEMVTQLAPLAKSGAVLLELNLSCPNVPGKPQIGYDFADMEHYLQAVSAAHGSPFGVKLPPYFDMIHFDQAAAILNRYPEVAFLTCINSVGNGLLVDVDNETTLIRPKGGFGGIGGQYVLPTALANVHAFHTRCPTKCIIGCGGIEDGRTAFAHILAGATLLQLGTALSKEGSAVFDRIGRELSDLMKEKRYERLSDFRGKLKVI